MGSQVSHLLPLELREYLAGLDIVTLAQAHNAQPDAHHYWFTAKELNLAGDWKLAWDSFVRGLELGRIRLHAQSDTLVWNHNRAWGSATAKSIYEYIVLTSQPSLMNSFHSLIWTSSLPTKIGCFI